MRLRQIRRFFQSPSNRQHVGGASHICITMSHEGAFLFVGPDGNEWDADFCVNITPDNAPNGGNTYSIDTLYVSRVDDRDACKRIDAPSDVDEVAADLIQTGAYLELI